MAITANCAEIMLTYNGSSTSFNKLTTTTELVPAKTIHSEAEVYLIQSSANRPQTFRWNLAKAIGDGYASLQDLYDYFVAELADQCGGDGIESVVAGAGIVVDNTDPNNPIVSATGGGDLSIPESQIVFGTGTGVTSNEDNTIEDDLTRFRKIRENSGDETEAYLTVEPTQVQMSSGTQSIGNTQMTVNTEVGATIDDPLGRVFFPNLVSDGDANKTILSRNPSTNQVDWVAGEFYFEKTIAEIRALITGSTLVPGAKYATVFTNTYDQSGSDVTKTAGTSETLVLTASSNNTFFPQVTSLDFPKDIIDFDITVATTFVNSAPCDGKITYRMDENGNSTPFDFRTVLMFNPSDSTEALFFDLTDSISENGFKINPALLQVFLPVEFPASTIGGDATLNENFFLLGTKIGGSVVQNSNNKFIGSTISGDVEQTANNILDGATVVSIKQTTGVTIFESQVQAVNQVANTTIKDASTFGGGIQQMINIDITNCQITGSSDYCTTGSWSNTTFAEQVNKCIGTNFNNSAIGDRIDRLINCAILTVTVGGRLYWCASIALNTSDIAGYFQGVNNLTWSGTDVVNASVAAINGITMFDSKCGFKDCTITGTTNADVFGGNLRLDCLVDTKTIDIATYPELFNTDYSKRIYKGSDDKIYFTFNNGATDVTDEIV